MLTLRWARAEDCRLVWEWANAAEVRAVSFTSHSIPWDSHVAWFDAKLADPQVFLYIAEDNGVAVGQIRYDMLNDDAVVSVSLDPKCRGRGYGAKVIEIGTVEIFGKSNARTIHAYIKPGNDASVSAFARAGFCDAGDAVVRGQPAIHMVKKKDS